MKPRASDRLQARLDRQFERREEARRGRTAQEILVETEMLAKVMLAAIAAKKAKP